MDQPIWLVPADDRPSTGLGAEIMRCEGFPWFDEVLAALIDEIPPGVKLIVVAGTGMSSTGSRRLARAVSQGLSLVVLAPDPVLAAALGLALAEPLVDAHIRVVALPGWEHGDTPLLCPGDGTCPLEGGQQVAALSHGDTGASGSGISRTRLGQGRIWFYGYDLCRTVASLRHGSGRLDPPPDQEHTWSGPRALYSFWELADKLPHDVPVADLHQDILRSVVTESLAGTVLPRLWHFPEAAPAGPGDGVDRCPCCRVSLREPGAMVALCPGPGRGPTHGLVGGGRHGVPHLVRGLERGRPHLAAAGSGGRGPLQAERSGTPHPPPGPGGTHPVSYSGGFAGRRSYNIVSQVVVPPSV